MLSQKYLDQKYLSSEADEKTTKSRVTDWFSRTGVVTARGPDIHPRWLVAGDYYTFPTEEEETEYRTIADFISAYIRLTANQYWQLHADVSELKLRVEELTRIIAARISANNVFLSNLNSEKLYLTQPLSVFVEQSEEVTIVSSLDLNLFGYGDTESEAVKDFCESFEELYFSLKRRETRLSKNLRNLFEFMARIATERG